MQKLRFLMFMGLALVIAALPWGVNFAYGNAGPAGVTFYANSPSGVNAVTLSDTGTPMQKFVDSLPGLGPNNANNLGNFIPIATKMTDPSGHGDDYYEIGIVDYTMKMHTNLPKATKLRGYKDLNPLAPANPNTSYYLGPVIIAQRDKPVRIKFTNQLGIAAAGNLFVPVDETIMGAGMGPDGMTTYSQNRQSIHLHGGFTPWISDGTPHQWITPAGETNKYKTGVSQKNVPDMPDPGQGSATYYYTNQQSNRLMFYHDHALGITRLNVYAGVAAGYLITDPQEEALINAGTIPGAAMPAEYRYGIPLVIQDKSFVPKDVATQDSKWDTVNWGTYGDLWFPHVYEPNQTAAGGMNDYGRWDFGPWVWPNITAPVRKAVSPLPGTTIDNPAGYAKSIVPEGFMDTPVVNGCAYPYVQVQPTAYRFRILNACNDRFLNLQLYQADTGGGGSGATATAAVATPGGPITGLTLGAGGTGYTSAPGVYVTGGGGSGAYVVASLTPTTAASLTLSCGGSGYTAAPLVSLIGGGATTAATATATVANGMVTGLTLNTPGAGYTSAPFVVFSGGGGNGAAATVNLTPTSVGALALVNPGMGYTTAPTVTIASTAVVAGGTTGEVKLVPAVPTAGFGTWPTDGRVGGVPDPATQGPGIIQIGSEGGFLPGVAALRNQPLNYDYDRGSATVLNVLNTGNGYTLFMGPAERADVIIDFSQYAGKTLILYNDAPAPVPGFQPRYDYYTGDPDLTSTGGAPSTLPGYGPNTRTIMQIQVAAGTNPAFDRAALETALPAAYVASQPPPIVPQTYYPPPYQAAADTYGTIFGNSLTFTPVGATAPKTQPALAKAIIEMFDDYGRMNATLGTEITDWTAVPAASTGYGFPYVDPPNDVFKKGEAQIWKITHNGVDTHAIHFHLVNVQVINRLGWDGVLKPPDVNERGWKETIKMNPLEIIWVAMKADLPTVPFGLPVSIRPLNPSMPLGSAITTGFSQIDPATGQAFSQTVYNKVANFGYEYVWHCHLLGHEENDMMRPLVVAHPVVAPMNLLQLLQ